MQVVNLGKQMSFACLIVAAGRGTRAGDGVPKQYRDLGGCSVLRRTIDAFLGNSTCQTVQIVIHPDDQAHYEAAILGLNDQRLRAPVLGGSTRAISVRAGLERLGDTPPDIVLIHDAARPFISADVIARVCNAVKPGQAAFPALPIVDALWKAEDSVVKAPQARDGLWRAQTPQGFMYRDIRAAHMSGPVGAPDDVSLAHAAGLAVKVVMGDGNNFKITLAEDFQRAERLLRDHMDIRTGQGFDVHAFGPGDAVVLCGVSIPFEHGLKGHSDADVAMHAITDALFGALAEGDIGQWFPPNNATWKGAASEVFLQKAMERVRERGFAVGNIDCTLICEMPKIGPHAPAMRAEIARITDVALDRISVKATTSERLGFTGRGEGIASMATATLIGS